MPSTSKKQHNFMAAIAHNPAFAKKVGIPQSVGKDFDEADKGKKFGSGGRTRPDVQKVNKPKTQHGKMALFKEGGDMKKMNMGGYADGGMPMVNKGGKMVPSFAADGKGKMAKGGIATSLKAHAAAPASKAHGMKKGGMAASKMGAVKTGKTPDGIATKGKTKGKMITMKNGGKC